MSNCVTFSGHRKINYNKVDITRTIVRDKIKQFIKNREIRLFNSTYVLKISHQI